MKIKGFQIRLLLLRLIKVQWNIYNVWNFYKSIMLRKSSQNNSYQQVFNSKIIRKPEFLLHSGSVGQNSSFNLSLSSSWKTIDLRQLEDTEEDAASCRMLLMMMKNNQDVLKIFEIKRPFKSLLPATAIKRDTLKLNKIDHNFISSSKSHKIV